MKMILELILNWNPKPWNHPRNSKTQNPLIFNKNEIFRTMEFKKVKNVPSENVTQVTSRDESDITTLH